MQTVIGAGPPGALRRASHFRRSAPNSAELVRRSVDLILSSLALVFFAPLMLLVAVAIWMQDRGPVFFAHTRVGRDGQVFKCLKFRSMLVDSESRLQHLLANSPEARGEWERDHKLRSDPRITALGSFLRRSSLDELPQLFNVLVGEMSLVGPRPIVAGEVKRYGRRFGNYCSVRPGITGLWQISGRNDVSYRRRVAIDTYYAQQQSIGLDLWILIATIPSVLLRKGSY